MSTYHYAGDNPIMMNDPTGNASAIQTQTESKTWYSGWYGTYNSGPPFPTSAMEYGGGGGGGTDSFYASAEAENIGEINQYDAALAASTSIYHAGDGTEEDPTTGSLSQGINAIIGGTASYSITAVGGGIYSITGNKGSNLNGVELITAGAIATGLTSGDPGSPGQYHIAGPLPGDNPNTQVGGLCVFYSAAAIKNHFNGGNESGTDFFYNDYAFPKGLTIDERNYIVNRGILPEKVLSVFFVYQPTTDITRSLLDGYPVMAEIRQYANCIPGTGQADGKGYHEVFITGFSYFWGGLYPGFNYTFYNSQTNHYENLPPFEFHWAYEIHGLK
jgi:hypothetical protein